MSFHNREITHFHDNVYKLVATMKDSAGNEESRFNGVGFVREEDTFFQNSYIQNMLKGGFDGHKT